MSDRLSDYRYELPEERIAQTPLEDRAASRLLWLHKESGEVEHRRFREVADILREGDLLVLNDTRVSAWRLLGQRPTGGAVEALLLRPLGEGRWECLLRPGKRLKQGSSVRFGPLHGVVGEDLGDGRRALELDGDPAGAGHVPLPPYIQASLPDPERYQTVYASQPGSAAAPTAGLHFTPEILDALEARGVRQATVTLHVGLDTFRPVTAERLDDHQMHGEWCEVPEATAWAVAEAPGRIVAVGTTTVRTLETMAQGSRRLRAGTAVSTLFIRPGFEFRIVDGMFTNLHLPGTTMMAMLAALTGRERLLDAYRQAVGERYRFLSFGDSMLVL